MLDYVNVIQRLCGKVYTVYTVQGGETAARQVVIKTRERMLREPGKF
jgi:hypothetical protein